MAQHLLREALLVALSRKAFSQLSVGQVVRASYHCGQTLIAAP
jgi:hypothetical protein